MAKATKADFFKTNIFTSEARKTFMHIEKQFTKALIFYHFESEYHILMEINIFSIAINESSSHINLT